MYTITDELIEVTNKYELREFVETWANDKTSDDIYYHNITIFEPTRYLHEHDEKDLVIESVYADVFSCRPENIVISGLGYLTPCSFATMVANLVSIPSTKIIATYSYSEDAIVIIYNRDNPSQTGDVLFR